MSTPSPSKKNGISKQRMSKLIQYRGVFLRYKGQFGLGILALLVTNAAGAAIPRLIQEAIDLLRRAGQSPVNSGQLEQLLGWMLGLAVVVFAARVMSRIWITGAGQRIEYDLRDRLYRHLLAMPSQFYAAYPSGELMSRMTNDLEAMRMMVGGGIMLGFNLIFAYLTTLPMMIEISPLLTLVTFILYPLAIWILNRLSLRVKKLYYNVQTILGEFSAIVQENFTGIAVIQGYGKEATENRRIEREAERYYDVNQSVLKKWLLMVMILVILGGVSYLAVLGIGGWLVIEHQMTLGGFIAFTLYLERIIWPTASMGWVLSNIQQGAAALERVDDVLSQTPSIISPEHPAPLPQPVRGAVEIRHLNFAYHNPYRKTSPEQPETSNDSNNALADSSTTAPLVLHDINLSIAAGETVAIVGPIGAGKSTLLRLLPRLYDIPEGAIFLDGLDITQLALPELRDAMVLMPQQSFLFSSSVGENMLFSAPGQFDIRRDEVVPVAEVAQVHDEVMHLPKNYDTLVGERGVMLSGGQRQRVSLTRTLLHSQLTQAPVLILDDPFSQVDAGTEEAIIQALEERRLLSQKTTLFATHRMSMVKKADRVIVMNAGQIVATGSHVELIKSSSLYQQLYQPDEHTNDASKSLPANGSSRAIKSLATTQVDTQGEQP